MLEACLLDPDLMDERTSNTSAISTSRGKFRQDVTERDGTCVMTGSGEGLQACHIVPHAKGHQVCYEYLLNRSTGVLIPGQVHDKSRRTQARSIRSTLE